jgi:CHAT domain-containing protein
MRRSTPHYANLKFPKPMTLGQIRATLDEGTLLLDFFVGENRSYVFEVGKHTFKRHAVPVSREALQTEVSLLLESLTDERKPFDRQDARRLYSQLIEPAKPEIDRTERLLLSPEKFLWKLPFCALVTNDDPANPRYLVENKPLHSILSMNVYAELKAKPPRHKLASLVAFGDPRFGTESGSDELGGSSFGQVPLTGAQVRALARLYGTTAHLGKEATRSSVIKFAPRGRIVHLAVHAKANDGCDPLSSFLALTPEHRGERFGMLTAYDVMQNLRLEADLVTLAACETGAGQVSNTEGVIGLTRAFQYAGARSVLCTLWVIRAGPSSQMLSGIDPYHPALQPSETALSNSFYGALRKGRPKDKALRIAQVAMIHGSNVEYRDPRHWAAFTLQGYWK